MLFVIYAMWGRVGNGRKVLFKRQLFPDISIPMTAQQDVLFCFFAYQLKLYTSLFLGGHSFYSYPYQV